MQLKTVFKILKRILFCAAIIVLLIFAISWINIAKIPQEKPKNGLRILSMNVAAGNYLSNSLQAEIIGSQSDVIVLIEWTGNNINLDSFKRNGYKVLLDHPRKKVHGLCVLSKLDGVSAIIESTIETPCTLPIGQIRFHWKGQNISLFAIHAPPPVPACKGTTNEYIEAITEWIENGKLTKDIGIGKQNDLAIFAGDFNSFYFDKGIRKLKSKKLYDAFGKFPIFSQTWKPFTWSPHIARIDYILAPEKFVVDNTYRFFIPHSDHLGIIADFTLVEK